MSEQPGQPQASAPVGSETRLAAAAESAARALLGIAKALDSLAKMQEIQAAKTKSDIAWNKAKMFAIGLPLIVVILVYSVSISTVVLDVTKAHVAIVRVMGAIDANGPNSADRLNTAVRSAFENDFSKVVILHINSGGGSPTQALAVRNEVIAMRAQYPHKAVYAVAEDTVASAAYLIATAADEIWVQPTTLAGSIGVRWQGLGVKPELLERLGVESRLFTSGEHKARFDPFEPLSADDQAKMKSMLSRMHEQFIAQVRERRGDKLVDGAELFNGDVWLGDEAVELGLADRVGGLDDLVRERYGELRIRKTYAVKDWTDYLAGFSSSVSRGLAQALAPQPAIQ